MLRRQALNVWLPPSEERAATGLPVGGERLAGRTAAERVVLAIVLFALIREWLSPILIFADVVTLREQLPFLAVIAFVLLLDGLGIPLRLSWPIKLLAACVAVQWAMAAAGIPGAGGGGAVVSFVQGLMRDLLYMLESGPAAAGPYSRTLLFTLGWCMLSSVLYTLMVQLGTGLWFVGSTLIYLVVLHYGAETDYSVAVLRTFVLSLPLLAIQRQYRLAQQWSDGQALSGVQGAWDAKGEKGVQRTRVEWDSHGVQGAQSVQGVHGTQGVQAVRGSGAWAVAGLALALVLAAVGWLAGAREDQTARPIAWEQLSDRVTSWLERYSSPSADDRMTGRGIDSVVGQWAVSGYGGDDSVLGGPLKQDRQVAFTARTGQLTYWRGESKDVYDGRGWSSSGAAEEAGNEDGAVRASSGVDSTNGETALTGGDMDNGPTIVQEIVPGPGFPTKQLFAGGVIAAVDSLITSGGQMLDRGAVHTDPLTGKSTVDTGSDSLTYYKLQVIPPVGIGGTTPGTAAVALSGQQLSRYLQLPDALPGRVRRLAAELTSGLSDPLQKAVAIERYLSEHYRYSLTEPDMPAKGKDFVDHFLFEQESGYCDYFSTAMTVLLRTAGLPARWVKGFAPGQLDLSARSDGSADEASAYAVTVRNSDAHSWVELYVSGIGWVPFDPTPGFPGMGGEQLQLPQADGAQQPQTDTTSKQAVGQASPAGQEDDAAGAEAMNGWIPQAWLSLANQWREAVLELIRSWGPFTRGQQLSVCAGLLALPMLWTAYRAWRERRLVVPLPGGLLLLGLRRGPRQRRSLQRVLARMWRRVEGWYGPLRPGQTCREYAACLSTADPVRRRAVCELTLLIEEACYGAPDAPCFVAKRRLRRLWQQLQPPQPQRKRVAAGG